MLYSIKHLFTIPAYNTVVMTHEYNCTITVSTRTYKYNTAVIAKQHTRNIVLFTMIREWGTCQSRSPLWSRRAPAFRRQRYSQGNVRGRRLRAVQHSEQRATPPNRRGRTRPDARAPFPPTHWTRLIKFCKLKFALNLMQWLSQDSVRARENDRFANASFRDFSFCTCTSLWCEKVLCIYCKLYS